MAEDNRTTSGTDKELTQTDMDLNMLENGKMVNGTDKEL